LRRALVILFATGCLVSTDYALAQKKTSPAGSSISPPPKAAPCKAGEASLFKDEGLTVKLSTKLKFTKSLLRENIRAKVSGGVATLSGNVSTPEHVATAVSVASQLEGITCVMNSMKVGPPETADPSNPRL
jgi:hypothetical protein